MTTFVGQNLGAGDHARAKKGTRTALLLSEAVTVVVLLPLMLLSPQLISLFNQEPEVLRYGTLFIRFISPFYLVICINQIISGSLRGAGDSRSCMLIMLGSFVLFRQIYLMIVYRVWGTVLPVALGYPAGWVLCSVILLLYYRSGAWKKASVFKEKQNKAQTARRNAPAGRSVKHWRGSAPRLPSQGRCLRSRLRGCCVAV